MVSATPKRLRRSARNLGKIFRKGHIAESARTEFEAFHSAATYTLRRYGAPSGGAAILLVPPLMVATEVYDISQELSAVQHLLAAGLDVWAVDFGAPEHQDGGLSRDVEDHVLAIVDAVDRVAEATQQAVHVAGYSQGGMFVYEAAAYRRGDKIASLMTFGSPVDVRLAVSPWLRVALAEWWLERLYDRIREPLALVPALPGWITSMGFRVLSLRKELQQAVEFVRVLHDRDLLARREPRRAFIRGEGFVAWPGPAFRDFVRDIVVHNRLAEGVIPIGGTTVRLADLSTPILAFVGRRDEMVKPAGARAIASAAPNARCYVREVPAGHFGLVVGRVAQGQTWPTVIEWIQMVEKGDRLERRFERIQHIP